MLQLAAIKSCAAQSQPELILTIVPASYSSGVSKKAYISFDHTNHFHVLLTNNSSGPIKLFEEWNSWGYYGLSFEITYSDGRKVQSARERRGCDKNFPSTVTIAPHGYYIFDVNFNNDSKKDYVWVNSVRSEKRSDDGTHCSMRAIYFIESSSASIEEHAWTGTITSEIRPYTIWH